MQTLDDFGYHFVRVLRNKETEKEFVGDYETLTEPIVQYMYEYLEKELELEKIIIPVDAGPEDPKGFFFMSKNALTCEKLMLLIQGDGKVRSGLWSRRLTICKSFESGTMVPYIQQARQEDFGVIITNGNHNTDSGRVIEGSENPKAHFVYVWNNFIKRAMAKDIVIVAHSYGGRVVQHGLMEIEEARRRIKAVAFTNSVHKTCDESDEIKRWLKERARNWVTSEKTLDTPAPGSIRGQYDCDQVSAGTESHEETSYFAKRSVFLFFEEQLKADGVRQEIIACVNQHDLSIVSAAATAETIARYLDLDRLADPPADVASKCHNMCIYFKSIQRQDVIKELRSRIPSGITGPLLDENMRYIDIDLKTRKDMTRALCANDTWKLLASELKIPGDQMEFYEKHAMKRGKDNPTEAVLDEYTTNHILRVGVLYSMIVRCNAGALADKYL